MPKYNPLAFEVNDNLSLTPNRKARNEAARVRENAKVIFDPMITCKNSIEECFRIFTDPNQISLTPVTRQLQRGINLEHISMEVYTDGVCIHNGKLNTRCGSGLWIGENNAINKAIKIPGNKQSNQIREIAAIIAAAESLLNYRKLTIITDSRYVIDGLTKHLKTWEDNGWINIKNTEFFKKAAYILKRRTAPTAFKWVKGHQGNLGNEESDKLAKEGAEKQAPDNFPLDIPSKFDLQGAKLATLTQAIAYRGIRERKPQITCPLTNRNLNLIRKAIQSFTNELETDETFWKSLRKHSIRIRVKQFLFKAINNTPMIGDKWTNIQGYKERSQCASCRTTENMSHILLTCNAPPVNRIWDLARQLWPHENLKWPDISYGTIIGCTCISAQEDPQNARDRSEWTTYDQRGATCLLQITISEAAHLIWVLRCERVIQERVHTNDEITSRLS
jgi:ribonuclease HI